MPDNLEQGKTGSVPSGSPPEPKTPPSGDPNTGRPRDPETGQFKPAEPYRFPADWHIAWQRGKTAEEVGQLSQQMYQAMVGGGQPPQELAPPQQHQQYTYQQAPQPQSVEWDDMNPAGSVDARIQAQLQQFQPTLQQQAEAMGQLARRVVEQGDPDAFQRWGPEIDMELVRIQPAMRTEHNIRLVVDMVRGRHVKEIEAEAERRVRAQYQQGDLRPDGSSAVPTGTSGVLDLDKDITAEGYKRLLAKHNITERTLRELFQKFPDAYAGNTFEEKVKTWLDAANKGDVITEQAFQVGGI